MSRLRAAEVEIAVVQVEVIEADVAEVAVGDVRLHVAAAAAEPLGPAEIEPAANEVGDDLRLHIAAGMADVLGAAEIKPAAVGVDAVEADAVEIAAADG